MIPMPILGTSEIFRIFVFLRNNYKYWTNSNVFLRNNNRYLSKSSNVLIKDGFLSVQVYQHDSCFGGPCCSIPGDSPAPVGGWGTCPSPTKSNPPSPPLTGRQKPNQFAGQKQTVPVPVPVPALGQGSRVPGSGPGPRAGPSCGRVSLIGQLYQQWQERGRALQKLC